MRLTEGARILRITTEEELRAFDVEYGDPFDGDWIGRVRYGGIRWDDVAVLFDGIIIAPYQWPSRLDLMWYYGWDCASGCIWNLDVIESVTALARVSE